MFSKNKKIKELEIRIITLEEKINLIEQSFKDEKDKPKYFNQGVK